MQLSTVRDMSSAHRPGAEPEELLLPAEARALIGVSRATYTRYLDQGRLVPDVVLPSGHRRFKRSTVEAFVHTSTERAAAKAAS